MLWVPFQVQYVSIGLICSRTAGSQWRLSSSPHSGVQSNSPTPVEHSIVNSTSLLAQTVKHLPTVQETWVQSLGQEDPLEKEMATHSSIHAVFMPGKSHGLRSLVGYSPWGCRESDMTEQLTLWEWRCHGTGRKTG